jgi:hypothetical protein
MIWWFLILGASTLVVVCVVLALYMHLRHNLQKQRAADGMAGGAEGERRADPIER